MMKKKISGKEKLSFIPVWFGLTQPEVMRTGASVATDAPAPAPTPIP